VANQVPLADLIRQAGPELSKAADGLGKIPIGGTNLHVRVQSTPPDDSRSSILDPGPRARVFSVDGVEITPPGVEPAVPRRP
jgi:hypothetical protein